jgi:hypothetical protein
MAVLPTIAGGSGNAGLGGVYLNPADYPALRPARVLAIARRANAGQLDARDRARVNDMRQGTRAVIVSQKGVFGGDTRYAWNGYTGTGIRDDGSIGSIEFFEPSQDTGRRLIDRAANDREDVGTINLMVMDWTFANDSRRRDYSRAIDDALQQLVDNARRAAQVDASITTPQERIEAAAARDRAMRLASARAQKIGDRIAGGSTREARALGARLAAIQGSAGLIGAYAAALDRGADPLAAAEELVPEVPAEAETAEVSALDRLYPLEAPDYYLETFSALPAPWGALYLGFTGSADVPLESPDYYLQTLPTLPKPWYNLYIQAIQE